MKITSAPIEKSVILVPDIHGRPFWKDVIGEKCPIIFLGDYLDPYEYEGISTWQALDNFINILEFAEGNRNVQLLVGNHDCSYLISKTLRNSRLDYDNYPLFNEIFLKHKHLFKMLVQMEIGGQKFVFSHAGIHPAWLNNPRKNPFTIDEINEVMLDLESGKDVWCELGSIGSIRGGSDPAGSIVWADIREFINADLSCFDFQQIVGHTSLSNAPYKAGSITSIDVRRPFFIDTNGVLREMDGEEMGN